MPVLLDHIKPPDDSGRTRFLFGLDQWPPPGATLLISLQWLIVMVPGLLVLGQVLASALGLDQAARLALMQRLLLACALSQAMQVLWGHRLPGLVGTSTVLVVGVISTAQARPEIIFGGMMAGGALTALAALAGLGRLLRRLFTRPILAATLMLISVNLAPALRGLLWSTGGTGGGPAGFFFGLGLCLLMLAAGGHLRGVWSAAVMLMGLLAGSGLYGLLGLAGPGHSWQLSGLALPSLTLIRPELEPGVTAAFVLCYLAVMSNELATVEALNQVVEPPNPQKRAGRALAVCGLGGLLSGLVGAPGVVTYSTSPALAVSCRSKSRYTFLPAAAGLVLLAFWPSGLELFGLAPKPVVGAILLYVMAASAHTSISILAAEGKLEWRDGVILGAAMGAGMVVAFLPAAAVQAVPALARPVLTNGFVVGLLAALVLEHLLMPRRRRA